MSDETTTTTLAERLLELLEAGRSKGRQDRAAGKVWAEILGVEHESPEYLRLIGLRTVAWCRSDGRIKLWLRTAVAAGDQAARGATRFDIGAGL